MSHPSCKNFGGLDSCSLPFGRYTIPHKISVGISIFLKGVVEVTQMYYYSKADKLPEAEEILTVLVFAKMHWVF